MKEHIKEGDPRVSELLQQPYAPPDPEGIPGNAPHWGLPGKSRSLAAQKVKERESLADGFDTFYTTADPNLTTKLNIGGKTFAKRKIAGPPNQKEDVWVPSLKKVEKETKPERMYGKRFTLVGESTLEYSDIPRGKKHLTPLASDQLQNEMEAFQLKKRVMNPDGVPISNAKTRVKALMERDYDGMDSKGEAPLLDSRLRRVDSLNDRRNGVPAKVVGDKMFTAAEYAPQFHTTNASTLPRLGYERVVKPTPIANSFDIAESKRVRQRDIQDVLNLPKYPKGATKS